MLNLPLCAVEFIRECTRCFKKQPIDKATVGLTISAALAECFGMLTVEILHIPSSPILGEIGMAHNYAQFKENLGSTCNAFLQITGLKFCTYGLKWIPLFVIAAILFLFVILAICRIVRRKDSSPLAVCIFYCCISLAAVAVVGIFIMRIRQIYFFVYYLLVAFSVLYFYETIRAPQKVLKTIFRSEVLIVCLCLCGMANFIFNFVPCMNHKYVDNLYFEIERRIEQDGIDNVWVFITTSPTVAAYSQDKIIAGTVRLNSDWQEGETDNLLIPNPYLSSKSMYETPNEYVYLLSSNWDEDNYFKKFDSKQISFFLEQCQIVEKFASKNLRFTLYKVPKNILDLSCFGK